MTMKFIAVAQAALLLTQPSLGNFEIPYKMADGVWEYTVTRVRSPKPLKHERVEITVAQHDLDPYNAVFATEDDTKRIKATSSMCGKGKGELEAHREEMARLKLEDWCEMYDPDKTTIVLSVHNDTIWYVCNLWSTGNFPWNTQSCSRQEIKYAKMDLDSKCGERGLGFVRSDSRMIEYGRIKTSETFRVCSGFGTHT